MERTITVVSRPRPARNPAHSNDTYDAPTHNVLPGEYGKEKRSSLEEKNGLFHN